MLCCLSSLLIDSGWTGGLLGVRWNLNRDMSGLDSERCGADLTGDTSRALLLKCAGQLRVTCQERMALDTRKRKACQRTTLSDVVAKYSHLAE